jgi:hypothetical protein
LATVAVAALALVVVVLNAPAMLGPYGPLTIILVGMPYAAVGLVGAVAAAGIWRERGWGRPLALIWAAATMIVAAIGLLAGWAPVIESVGDPTVSYNLALPDLYVPIPFLVGAGYVLMALLRVPSRVWLIVGALLVAVVLIVAAVALESPSQPTIDPAPMRPTPSAP